MVSAFTAEIQSFLSAGGTISEGHGIVLHAAVQE